MEINQTVIVFKPIRLIRIIPRTLLLYRIHPSPYQPIQYRRHHLLIMPKPQQNPHTNIPVKETSYNNYVAASTVKSIWKFPEYDYLKLNTDGSSKGPASFGGLIRDGQGRWLCGYVGKMKERSFTSLEAEVWSVYRGLCLIRDKNLSNVVIETDCQAILMLGGGEIDDNSHPLIKPSVVEAIQTILIEHKCTIIHTRRDGNHCADQLAKLGGMQSEEYLELEEPPEQLLPYLLQDIKAAAYFERNHHH